MAHYNQTLVDALKSISDQLIRRESMDKQHVFAAASVAAAQRTYDIAMVAFQRGLTDYLNVLNAQSLLFKQQQVQQQVEAARLSVHADLVTALGGGLDSVGAVECNEAAIFPQTLESPTKRSKDRSLRQLLRSAYEAQSKREQAPSPRC